MKIMFLICSPHNRDEIAHRELVEWPLSALPRPGDYVELGEQSTNPIWNEGHIKRVSYRFVKKELQVFVELE